MFEIWKHEIVTAAVAVAVGGVKCLSPLLAANEFVRTLFADSLQRTVSMYVHARKFRYPSILTRVVLSEETFVLNDFR